MRSSDVTALSDLGMEWDIFTYPEAGRDAACDDER
jgi:hypothetical protein